jgi:hypothetical protein
MKLQLPKDIMTSIYKLVAERRDRNQSIKRKRSNKNINLFKDSIEEVQYRRPTLSGSYKFAQRAVSDQPPRDQIMRSASVRRPTNDISMINVKNQIKDVDTKVDALTKKVDELTKVLSLLRNDLNKK